MTASAEDRLRHAVDNGVVWTLRNDDLPDNALRFGESVIVVDEWPDDVLVYTRGRGPVRLDADELDGLRRFLGSRAGR